MKTDDLIDILALEPAAARSPTPAIALWGAAGAVAAAVAAVALMGPRHDLGQLAGVASLAGKAGYTLCLAGVGLWLLDRLGRPGASARTAATALALLLGGGLLASLLELALAAPGARASALMGSTAASCMVAIPLLSLFVLPPVIWTARRLAPTRPVLAGAAAGLLAGGLTASAYGLHCAEMTVSFLVVWYGLGVALVAGFGAAAGARLLRW